MAGLVDEMPPELRAEKRVGSVGGTSIMTSAYRHNRAPYYERVPPSRGTHGISIPLELSSTDCRLDTSRLLLIFLPKLPHL